jgi:tRNA (guanine-N7-)-methyltransferase
LESRYTVEWLLAPESVSRLHLLCPDPWPKVRHHRRRLVQQEFLDAVERVLVPGGEFLFKTDHAEYFQWVAAEVASHGALTELPWEEDDFFYPKTDFQQHWEGQGKPIYQARYRRPGETAGN